MLPLHKKPGAQQHGSGFNTATGQVGRTSVHGYENAYRTSGMGSIDTFDLSCTQGWTCGNVVTTTRDVARFFWQLLGPPSEHGSLLSPASLRQMQAWQLTEFSPRSTYQFSYGLGLMNFNTMPW